jgi:YesN/AraC family two-component response regulator
LSQYPGIQVVGEAESGPVALELVAQLQPDVVLLDIRLAGGEGRPGGLEVAGNCDARSPMCASSS